MTAVDKAVLELIANPLADLPAELSTDLYTSIYSSALFPSDVLPKDAFAKVVEIVRRRLELDPWLDDAFNVGSLVSCLTSGVRKILKKILEIHLLRKKLIAQVNERTRFYDCRQHATKCPRNGYLVRVRATHFTFIQILSCLIESL